MRVIQEGDIVVISKNLDKSKYNQGVWWNPFVTECLGKLGKVTYIGKSFAGDTVVCVEFQDPQIAPMLQTFGWFLEDVLLHYRSKWRRQSIGEGK